VCFEVDPLLHSDSFTKRPGEMTSRRSRSEKKRRLELADPAENVIPRNTLRLIPGRNLASPLENIVLSFLLVDEIGEVAFLSRGCLRAVKDYFAAATAVTVGSPSAVLEYSSPVFASSLVRHMPFIANNARRLRSLTIRSELGSVPAQTLGRFLVPVVLSNSETLQCVRVPLTYQDPTLSQAAASCPQLTQLTPLVFGGTGWEKDANLLQFFSGCARLASLSLTTQSRLSESQMELAFNQGKLLC
jgi:hypothetical protein